MSQLPAYFLNGPHHGECMSIGGAPPIFLFPVSSDPLVNWRYLPDPNTEPWNIPNMRTDHYNRVQAVMLYGYAGRF